MQTKTVKSVSSPQVVTDGVGCKVRRIVEGSGAPPIDPFLMLDLFSAKFPAGFYDHPHRGFEMATYMLKGSIIHEDFRGNKTVLSPGDFSWSNIGKGVIHSEMPASSTEESVGLLFWVNVPKEEKYSDYTYKKYESRSIPVLKWVGVEIKVLAGEAFKLKGPVMPKAEALILDVDIQDECIFEHIIPKGWNGLVFPYEGDITVVSSCKCCGRQPVQMNQSATLQVSKEDRVLHIETGKKSAKFLLIAGRPLNEPVHQHGPFVLATQEELRTTFEDYRAGVNGFEGANEFASELGNKLKKPSVSK